jgi:NADPH:quinone reductase-like Zn-dependent oxidoreductase
VPADGRILVEVHAASLNVIDTAIRSGALQKSLHLQFPATLGGDVAGVEAELGPATLDFAAAAERGASAVSPCSSPGTSACT